MVDVHALSALLRQLDFKVVSLLDLRKAEMQMAVNEFLLLLDKGVYGAAAPTGAAPARGQPGGFVLVGSCGGGWARSGHRVGQGTSPTFLPSQQVCSTTPGTAMKILATASWCPSTHPAPTPRHTACACSGCCGACSSAAPASTSSCSTCAARGDRALATSPGTRCQEVPAPAPGCWFPGGAVRGVPGVPSKPVGLVWMPQSIAALAEPANAPMGGQRDAGQPPGSGVPRGGFWGDGVSQRCPAALLLQESQR